MKTKTRGTVVASALLAVTGCVLPVEVNIGDGFQVRGSGHVVTETRGVAPFDGIRASGAVIVHVVESGFEGVRIVAEDNLIPYLETRVEGGMLIIGFESGVSVSPKRDVLVEVDAYELVEVRASGAVQVEAELGWKAEMWVGLSGASSLVIYGGAERLTLDLSGASRYEGLEFETERADIGASGASWAFVWAQDRLDAVASGASHIRFRGRPQVRANVSGASSVTPY
jgi:hypothetical protein